MALVGTHTEKIAKSVVPVSIAPLMKLIASYPRYLLQGILCRKGFKEFGHLYRQNILFVAGLPKSGTTWLERMLCDFSGYHTIMIPEAIRFEYHNAGSHSFDLPPDLFLRMEKMLAVLKLHVHGSPSNLFLLHQAGLKYVVLYRDLRDVAVSHFFYVRKTPWHPEHRFYAEKTPVEGLKHFAATLLPVFVEWVETWHRDHDPGLGLLVRYEDMLADPAAQFNMIVRHFGLECPESTLQEIIERNSFNKLSGGRKPGQQSSNSFFRKGVAGDWRSHFDQEMKDIYKKSIAEFLVKFSYEKDDLW